MNFDLSNLENTRTSKLNKEKNAFLNCASDMSDVRFEIGKTSYTAKIIAAIIIYAVVFGGRFALKSVLGASSNAIDMVFWILIALIFVLFVFFASKEKSRAAISVSGKTLFCNGNCFNCNDISCVKCTKWFENVEVYSAGKKVLSFPWELDNSELLIAWANKCGIPFEDNRMKR